MPKQGYPDVFTKPFKKQLSEKPQGETSEGGQGVSMPPKERLEPIEGIEAEETPSGCSGYECECVSYKDIMGRLVLWCSKVNEKVYDIEDCPCEYWFKDDKGRIIKKGSRP